MKGVASWFFGTAALAVMIGMGWGIAMAATGDHSLAPAHAHLNLVGWVTMGLFGVYYHLVPAAAGRLAQVHFGVALVGVALMVPGIAMAQTGGSEALAKGGSVLSILSMLIFLVTVFRHNRLRG